MLCFAQTYAIIHLKVGDNMKRKIIINIIPFVFWLLWFYCEINSIIPYYMSMIIQILLLLCLPLVFTILNFLVEKSEKSFLKYNIVSCSSHILGYYLRGLLYYCFISDDPETLLVVNLLSFLSLLVSVLLTGICYVVKKYF